MSKIFFVSEMDKKVQKGYKMQFIDKKLKYELKKF